MAVTAVLAYQGPNRLIYQLTDSGGGGTLSITTTGAASPDLLTDSGAGLIKKLALAHRDGYGRIPPGSINQAKARALWQSQWLTVGPAPLGQCQPPTARCLLQFETGVDAGWSVRATSDGANAIISVTCTAAAGGGTASLIIEVPGQIGN